MMNTCFIIQPFDNGPFDKRYEDIFVPAITAADLEPYRVDRDPAAVIPIEQIEEGIRRADACLADISTNNPNVWFELGFAIAAGKPVILVCEYQQDRRFPFDVQHRAVIIYKTESARDFESLKTNITQRLQAAIAKEDAIERVVESARIAEVEGLNQHEIVALVTIGENLGGPEDIVSAYSIRNDMERAGYTRIAVMLALTTLLRKGMLRVSPATDDHGEIYTAYSLTGRGMEWLLENQNMFVLKRERKQPKQIEDDDIPF
jgi:nucleoside 2-deoxyribosyltransferase